MDQTGSVYEFFSTFPDTSNFLNAPWNGQADMVGEYSVYLFTQGGKQSLQDGMSRMLSTDITTLSPTCGK